MKQGTSFSMSAKFDGLDPESVHSIEFIFKEKRDKTSSAFKTAKYPDNVSLNTDTQAFIIPWTKAETYKVPYTGRFYMDSRITLNGVADQPETEIVELFMNPTLFDEKEVV